MTYARSSGPTCRVGVAGAGIGSSSSTAMSATPGGRPVVGRSHDWVSTCRMPAAPMMSAARRAGWLVSIGT